jgi:hypothetical protein
MAEDEADAIRRRMSELRRDLVGDVRAVSRDARAMTDWTLYVRRFPWAAVAIAALAGFALIPRRRAVISPDQQALAEMVRKKQLRLDVDHKAEKKQGMFGSLVTMAAAWAVKAGMSYIGERMRTAAINKAHEDQPERPATPVHAASTSSFNAPIMH